jgi:hypothetical protein
MDASKAPSDGKDPWSTHRDVKSHFPAMRPATEAEAKRALSNYSPTGFAYTAYYSDANCDQPTNTLGSGSVFGMAANACINYVDFSAMYRVVKEGGKESIE